ncbi:SPOR domain-containing protein [Candidatus Dependentiae bacterium]|nr:MAG: SPOR domain-containing protein [Candidatus Dependentiae bacterium]
MRHTDSIKLNNRQIGWVIATVIFIALISFSAGYFWGEKKSAERFLNRIGQEALADQVYSSICSLCDTENELELQQENGVAENDSEEPGKEIEGKQENNAEMTPTVAYYAQLVGFGTAKKANQFVGQLEKKGITAHVRERKSKTARGKIISWYQVITDPYIEKNALIVLVEKIKEQEHLHDVRIVTI